ncbi:DUF3108 domain-containing protein [Denitrificimonas sp. JX-1]|uniref:DUF3108 domain-containing protein n=1 Tax=Denitrificimonas halotolerans TaxID=3098930 RepID=A0ABU5GPR3_9GAMM|nr:DUF3108 domain-containing protein [Denitrificimonas sp. JX-1]MDY7218976.1 DUF3108 domain-containing protein [Denitrificimonas sp. JX-1]
MRRAILLTLAAVLLPASLMATELKPFSASYTADWKQLPFSGKAERSLKQQEDGTWKLDFSASMLVAGLNETSWLTLVNNDIQPQKYRYSRKGMGKSKKIKQDFDWQTKRVTGNDRGKPLEATLLAGVQDKSSYQLALQRDVADGKTSMSYQVLDGDELDTYDFRVLGEETVETMVGSVDAIKVERVRDPTQSKRITILWFAKDWDYLLVRLQQVEKDGKEYQIMLENGTVNNKAVQGSN